jgi:hypothetical protein
MIELTPHDPERRESERGSSDRESLTPELALVDPELARLARDRLPPSGDTSAWPGRPSLSRNEVGETSSRQVSQVDDARRTDKPSRPRRRGRVILVALGAALAAIAVYGLAPDSTVRERATNRTPKTASTRIDLHAKAHESTRAARAPGASAPTTRRHSGVLSARAERRAKSEPRRPFPTRVFIWPAVSNATSYKVEFFRQGREVFEALSATARFELPTRWVYAGRTYHLAAGVYTWKVLPAFGSRSRLRFGTPIIRSTWVARR